MGNYLFEEISWILEWLKNKYHATGLLIYFIPAIIMFIIAEQYVMVFNANRGYYPPAEGEYGGGLVLLFVIIAGVIILSALFLVSPILMVFRYPQFMIPYFTIAYGLLYYFYLKSKTVHTSTSQ